MEWRVVPSYPNYEVSENGDLRHKLRGLKKKQVSRSGYWEYKMGDKRKQKAHRLVAMAFIPNPENKPWINHIDGDKKNCHVSNLEWCTPKENYLHAERSGLLSAFRAGESHARAKLSLEDAMQIKRLKGKKKLRELSEHYGISITHVHLIQKGKSWKFLDEDGNDTRLPTEDASGGITTDSL